LCGYFGSRTFCILRSCAQSVVHVNIGRKKRKVQTMTECERLIQEGILEADFLKPETRECEIPAELKKLWAMQIDMVKQVERVCKKYGLTYFAIGGTAIGAVRHGGFIPWDDDVDIGLLREDYNKLLSVAHEFKEPYFLQTPMTDKYFFSPHTSLRNNNGTCITAGDERIKCNNGAVIHIFPLDGYADTKKLKRFVKRERIRNIVAVNNYHYNGNKNHFFIRRVLKLLSPIILGGSLRGYYKRKEKKCTEISRNNTNMVGIQFAHFGSTPHKWIWRKEVFDSVVWMPFEYTQIPVPVGYDEMLTVQYGDYIKLPPRETWINKHSWEMAPDTPYKEYCSKKYGVQYD